MKEENRSTQEITYPKATLYTINPTKAVIGSKLYLHIDRPVAIRLSHCTVQNMKQILKH